MSSCNDCIQIYLRHNSPSVHRYKASLNWINANDKVEPEKVVGPWGLNLKNPFKAWSIDNVITSSDIDCFCSLRFYFHHLSWKYPCHCPGFVFFPQLLLDHFIVPCSKKSIGRRPTHFPPSSLFEIGQTGRLLLHTARPPLPPVQPSHTLQRVAIQSLPSTLPLPTMEMVDGAGLGGFSSCKASEMGAPVSPASACVKMT